MKASGEALLNGKNLGSKVLLSLFRSPQSRKTPVVAGFSAQQQVP